MGQMTKENLLAAFAGESQAHMKYLIFAEKADKENRPNVARLFRATALAEKVHATNHLKALDMVGNTDENLQTGIDGETYEFEEMYPAFKAVAELQEQKKAIRIMDWAMEAEKTHAVLYSTAKEAVSAGKDVDFGDIHVCDVCGWTVAGDAPDKCPVCGAKHNRFTKF